MLEVNYISPKEIEFKVIRPQNSESNPDGENVQFKVKFSDVTAFNKLGFVLDT